MMATAKIHKNNMLHSEKDMQEAASPHVTVSVDKNERRMNDR